MSIGSGNGLAQHRRQAITWTNADPVHQCIYAVLGGDELIPWYHSQYHGFLTHWGRVMHICVGKLIIVGSDNGLSPHRRQAIIWTNAGLLSIGPFRTYFSENFYQNTTIFIEEDARENVVWEMASILYRPQCVNTWQHKEPGHQEPWWWPGSFEIFLPHQSPLEELIAYKEGFRMILSHNKVFVFILIDKVFAFVFRWVFKFWWNR